MSARDDVLCLVERARVLGATEDDTGSDSTLWAWQSWAERDGVATAADAIQDATRAAELREEAGRGVTGSALLFALAGAATAHAAAAVVRGEPTAALVGLASWLLDEAVTAQEIEASGLAEPGL